MRTPYGRRRAAVLLFLCAGSLHPSLALRSSRAADQNYTILLVKDGFALKGFVRQDQQAVVDPVSVGLDYIPKGPYYLDDRVRKIFFSPHYVRGTPTRQTFDVGIDLRSPWQPPNGPGLPPVRDIVAATPWNDSWQREVTYRKPGGTQKLTQHILQLTPQFVRTTSTAKAFNTYRWFAAYRTAELGPAGVAALLAKHADTKDDPKLAESDRIARRLRGVQFLLQANMLDEAQRALTRFRGDFPKEKEQAATVEDTLRKVLALNRWDDAKAAQAAGRHQEARALLATFAAAGADPRLLGEVRALRDAYAAADDLLKQIRDRLKALLAKAPDGSEKAVFTEAVAALAAELTVDHVLNGDGKVDRGRLAPFLSQAERADAAAKADDKPEKVGPRELLALAVSGWLLGAPAAEAKPENAVRLWRARQAVLAAERATTPEGCRRFAALLESELQMKVEEVAQLIGTLPPPEPLTPPPAPVERKVDKLRYRLQLPPEYHPGRAYPVLLALHDANATAKDALAHWSGHAARHGYVLAAPEWGGVYGYGSDDHAATLDTLRDLARRVAIDSDRVFLTGYGEGANAAYDIGLAHPDRFAGVLPIAGQPRFHVPKYWANAQHLPFYVVWGSRMGPPEDAKPGDRTADGATANETLFNSAWIPHAMPALGFQYLERGKEWFAAELDDACDWMSRKRRADAKAGFGRDGAEFRTLRSGDNRYYWVGVGDFQRGFTCESRAEWNANRTGVALSAQVAGGNVLHVRAVGVKRVTVWLEPNAVDFDKPVTLRINGGQSVTTKKVKPDLETLLEELHRSGDRKRLYTGRIDVKF